jgi:hypothetical protein
MFCLFLSLFDANIQSTTDDDLTHLFQGKGGYIVPIKMLKSSPKAEDGHGDSVLLSKHAGSTGINHWASTGSGYMTGPSSPQ